MNPRRIVVLLLAAVAAGGVALLVRGLFGGGTPDASARTTPPPISEAQVLVAASDLQPGQPLSASQVQWQAWPSNGVSAGLITKSSGVSAAAAVEGTVVRSPIVAGEPITYNKIVKTQSAGFMAATLTPGMRAVAITVSVASVAGGFILPNDRVDIIQTQNAGGAAHATSSIVLSDVRVLAIDQASDGKNQKAVSDVKTATLELAPSQAEAVARAQASGTLSLALRGLSDSAAATDKVASTQDVSDDDRGTVSIIRYGMTGRGNAGGN
ncbi:MAG: Flp pilus assembly protein CpaB [Alphaproteobacteria bacterium]|nr:Flp pilus assembly protein CpaB [Alphaproteobacteria bacterium]